MHALDGRDPEYKKDWCYQKYISSTKLHTFSRHLYAPDVIHLPFVSHTLKEMSTDKVNSGNIR